VSGPLKVEKALGHHEDPARRASLQRKSRASNLNNLSPPKTGGAQNAEVKLPNNSDVRGPVRQGQECYLQRLLTKSS